jgi:hypothetical protein
MKQEMKVSEVQCKTYSFFLSYRRYSNSLKNLSEKSHIFQVEISGDLLCLPQQGVK